jgi:GNAT superfamily N-acetyltransferase
MIRSLLGSLPGNWSLSAKRFWNALSGERNRFFFREWTLEPLNFSLSLDEFTCGHPDLDEFFKQDAFINEQHLLGKSYFLTRDGYRPGPGYPPIALICFCNASIHMAEMETFQKQEGVKYYEYLPAVKIARLAVLKEFQGSNIGSLVLRMTKSVFLTQNRTGCRILTVDAYKDDRVVHFYEENGFARIPETRKEKKNLTWTMYYDLKRFDPSDGVVC